MNFDDRLYPRTSLTKKFTVNACGAISELQEASTVFVRV